MVKTKMSPLVIGGSASAGGAVGAWAGAKLGERYGLRAGPWGIVAGALLGTIVGAKLAGMLNKSDITGELESDTP